MRNNGPAEEVLRLDSGESRLRQARSTLCDILRRPGNIHWGTQTDVLHLSLAFQIGFLVFVSRQQGNGKWIQYLNYPSGVQFEHWVILYWDDPMHYRLGEVTVDAQSTPTTFFLSRDMPAALVRHFNLCNPSAKIVP